MSAAAADAERATAAAAAQRAPKLHLSPHQSPPARDSARSRSVGRSQSLSQAGPVGGGFGTSHPGLAHDGVLGAADEASGSSGGAQLIRSSNTVSASSRLVRLERNRARMALQGVGLSEEDQEFYVPPSPVRSGPYAAWSDLGHGGMTAPAHPDSASPAQPTPTSFPGPQVQAAWNRAAEQEQHDQATAAASFVPPEPKRSSFVVVRGGKGDQALAERRSHQPQSSSAAAAAPGPAAVAADAPHSPSGRPSPEGQAQPLRHKNSLKPFLEQEREQLGGQEVEEDWERGLMAERKSGAEGPGVGSDEDPYNLTTPPLSSSFPPQLSSSFTGSRQPSSGAASYSSHQPRRQVTADPWLPPSSASTLPILTGSTEENPSLVRRHQSLHTYQRSGRQREASIEQTLSSSPASAGGWMESAAGEDVHQPRALGSFALAGASSIAGFGTRTRAGTSPAPLALHHSQSLGHGHGGPSQSPSLGTGAGARLSHSASLGSRSDAGAARALSPVMSGLGGAKSPWSPTEEETKQLGLNTSFGSTGGAGGGGGSGTLSRGGSNSSRGSHSHVAEYTSGTAPPVPTGGAALADEVRRLDDALGAMQIGAMLSSPAGQPGLERNSPSPHTLPAVQAAPPPPSQQGARRLPSLMTSSDALAAQLGGMGFALPQGPLSAAAFVPPIGHSHLVHPHALDGISEYAALMQNSLALPPHVAQQTGGVGPGFGAFESGTDAQHARGNLTAVPGASAVDWTRQKELLVGGAPLAAPAAALPFMGQASSAVTVPPPFPGGAHAEGIAGANGWPSPAALQQMQIQQEQIHVLQSQMAQALSAMDAMRAQGAVVPPNFDLGGGGGSLGQALGQLPPHGTPEAHDAPAETPIDVNSLVAKKGYNPVVFDLKPQNARFFVIKSYTEEDVHKSLKYEIWASTDLGNKRLDRAFRESADKGPIYLFFSVNASGHFAGMAQMLTPVDYSMSSNVWASDKWKGVLKVRWIFIKDVPLSALRHIRLSNTPENKPVTSSRDTQEVPYDAGLEVLRIIAHYQSRTSLLQDYAWYEAQFRRQQATGGVEGEVTSQAPVQQIPPHYAPAASQQQQQPQQVTGSPQQPGAEKGPRQQQQHQPQGGRRFWGRGGQGQSGGQAPAPPLQQHAPPGQNGMVRGPPPHLAQAQGYYGGPPSSMGHPAHNPGGY